MNNPHVRRLLGPSGSAVLVAAFLLWSVIAALTSNFALHDGVWYSYASTAFDDGGAGWLLRCARFSLGGLSASAVVLFLWLRFAEGTSKKVSVASWALACIFFAGLGWICRSGQFSDIAAQLSVHPLWTVWLASIGGSGVAGIVYFFAGDGPGTPTRSWPTIALVVLAIIVSVAVVRDYPLLRTVEHEEQGGVYRFGRLSGVECRGRAEERYVMFIERSGLATYHVDNAIFFDDPELVEPAFEGSREAVVMSLLTISQEMEEMRRGQVMINESSEVLQVVADPELSRLYIEELGRVAAANGVNSIEILQPWPKQIVSSLLGTVKVVRYCYVAAVDAGSLSSFRGNTWNDLAVAASSPRERGPGRE